MKLNNVQKNLCIFFSIILSIIFTSFFWDKIIIPFNNSTGAYGLLSEKNYNPSNDTLRYTFFISLPLILFFYLNLILKKKTINILELFYEKDKELIKNPSIINILFFVFIIFIIIEFFSLEFFVIPFDHFHDGTFLAPAQNFVATKKLWTASYLTHGGSDLLYPILMWKTLGIKSIGAARVASIFLTLILKIICVLFSYQITKILSLNKGGKIIFFTIFTSIIISMSHYNLQNFGYYLIPRHLYIMLFLVFFIELFVKTNFRNICLVLTVLISTISIFLHIDSGFYLNLILFSFLIYLFFSKKYNDALLILFSLIAFWLITIQIIGYDEFKAFLNNTKTMISSMDLMHGFEYPKPFFSIFSDEPNGARATRGLILQLSAGLFILNYLISNSNNLFKIKNIFLVFLFLLSFVMYKNGLGRSDAGHIRISSSFPVIINIIFVLNYLIIFLYNKKVFLRFFSTKSAFLISIALLTFFYVSTYSKYKIQNIKNFNTNFTKYIYLEDEVFLTKKEIELINNYKIIFKHDNCITNFTLDDGLSYLLKKSSCSKYWSTWLTSPTILQNNYINNVKKIEPNYIIYNPGGNFDNLTLAERVPISNLYILSKYIKHQQFEEYIILKKR